MKCPYCGKEVEEGSKFCDGCGAKLEETKKVDEYVYYQPKKSKAGLIAAIIIISILLITGIILGIVLLTKDNGKSNNNSNNNSNTENNKPTDKDNKNVSDNISFSDYQLENGDIIVLIENKNTKDTTVDVSIEFYDEDKVEVDHDSETLVSMAPGQESVIKFYNSERNYKNYKIKAGVSNSSLASFYKNYYKEVEISSKDNKNDKEIEVKFSNNSDSEIDAKVAVLFYKNGKIVGYNYDYDYGIEANKTIAMYVDYPYDSNYDYVDFDDYKVYIIQAYKYAF